MLYSNRTLLLLSVGTNTKKRNQRTQSVCNHFSFFLTWITINILWFKLNIKVSFILIISHNYRFIYMMKGRSIEGRPSFSLLYLCVYITLTSFSSIMSSDRTHNIDLFLFLYNYYCRTIELSIYFIDDVITIFFL